MDINKKIIQKLSFKIRVFLNTIYSVNEYRHSDYGIILSSIILGIIVGLFVVVFHKALTLSSEFFHNLTFQGEKIISLRILIIPVIPAIGGLIVGILKMTLFKGVTMDNLHTLVEAIVRKEGRIDWRNSFKSIIFAALTIGSGGGAGREGPIMALGGSLGSILSNLFKLKPSHYRLLCGIGASSAISAIFNAPLGGIVFALEAILGEITLISFVPIVLSSVVATATTRFILGNNSLLIAPSLSEIAITDFVFLSIAGMLSGLVSAYYLKVYRLTFNYIKKSFTKIPEVLKPMIGGFLVGIILIFLPSMLETSYMPINEAIAGRGYNLVNDSIFAYLMPLFNDNFIILWAIVALATMFVKPISNAITIASSGSGGTFAPAIKAGAMFGFAFGILMHLLDSSISPGLYAIVCAAAVLSGTYQIPLASGIILFEISNNYNLILPLIFSSVFASFIISKMNITTFNPLQPGIVDDDSKLYPKLLIEENKNNKT